jgi:hypothetical protein
MMSTSSGGSLLLQKRMRMANVVGPREVLVMDFDNVQSYAQYACHRIQIQSTWKYCSPSKYSDHCEESQSRVSGRWAKDDAGQGFGVPSKCGPP